MTQTQTIPSTPAPSWLMPGGQINEVRFCQEFRKTHDLACDGERFYSREGLVVNEKPLRHAIYAEIAEYISTNVQQRVEKLMGALRLDCSNMLLQEGLEFIHVKNGTYSITGAYSDYKHHCRYRLGANYRPNAPKPERWLSFLEELLEPEDILTLQEFMGYCLVPLTVAQKMLIITGSGGEGKSRIGVVMRALLGNACGMGSLAKVETNRFARADLENLLVMVDDDLKMEALQDTNYIKTIVTAETPMDLERKGKQSYQGKLHVRFLAFGNDTLRALHDRSFGFFRRQIILTAKPIPKDRVNDPYLGVTLCQELDGIFLWCLEGLNRLVEQNMQFTISPKAAANMQMSMAKSNNILDFLASDGYFRRDPDGSITSRSLYGIYRDWCDDNNLTPLSARSFSDYLCQNGQHHKLRYTTNVPIGGGKHARGFVGIGRMV